MIGPRVMDCLRQIEAKTAASLARDHDVVMVGPFQAAIHPTLDLVWMSYAIPLSAQRGNVLDASTIKELRQVFRQRQRCMRFEFFEALWPDLGRLLEENGVELHSRMPLMLCGRVNFVPFQTADVRVVPVEADGDETILHDFLLTAARSFGSEVADVSPAELAAHRASIRQGVLRSVAAYVDGKIAGVGSMVLGSDELAGVGTLPEYRRRGIAATVSSYLVADHFNCGGTQVWLSAGDAIAERTYRKIGFEIVGTQLNYIDGAVH